MANSNPQPPAIAAAQVPAAWRVQLPAFEGPLDLLLHLVRINQVTLTDIPVATICDQFHAYLELMEELDLDVAGEFIYEAAQLIVLKSKLLLPRPTKSDGTPLEGEDPRQELVQRLLEYRRLKDAAQVLAEVDRVRQGLWTRKVDARRELGQEEAAQVELAEVSLFDLLSAMKSVLVRFDREHPEPIRLRPESYPVRGQFERLLATLSPTRPLDLLADFRSLSCRAEVISAFLAVLELARLNLVRIHQTGVGDLLLFRTTRELSVADFEAIQT